VAPVFRVEKPESFHGVGALKWAALIVVIQTLRTVEAGSRRNAKQQKSAQRCDHTAPHPGVFVVDRFCCMLLHLFSTKPWNSA
jgi:hypothetical protein